MSKTLVGKGDPLLIYYTSLFSQKPSRSDYSPRHLPPTCDATHLASPSFDAKKRSCASPVTFCNNISSWTPRLAKAHEKLHKFLGNQKTTSQKGCLWRGKIHHPMSGSLAASIAMEYHDVSSHLPIKLWIVHCITACAHGICCLPRAFPFSKIATLKCNGSSRGPSKPKVWQNDRNKRFEAVRNLEWHMPVGI